MPRVGSGFAIRCGCPRLSTPPKMPLRAGHERCLAPARRKCIRANNCCVQPALHFTRRACLVGGWLGGGGSFAKFAAVQNGTIGPPPRMSPCVPADGQRHASDLAAPAVRAPRLYSAVAVEGIRRHLLAPAPLSRSQLNHCRCRIDAHSAGEGCWRVEKICRLACTNKSTREDAVGKESGPGPFCTP